MTIESLSAIGCLSLLTLAASPATEALQSPTPQSTSRRDFLLQSAAAVTAGSSSSLWLPPSAANAQETAAVAPTLKLPPMGLGCWAWGDSLFWGYNPKNDADLEELFQYAVSKSPPVLLDTAELYGFGRSESLVGEFSKTTKEGDTIVASKFAALPFRTKPENVVKACKASVSRLGGKPIDLYQIHFPNAYANEAYWDGMAMAYEQGLIKAVGVSNYGVDATKACHDALAKRSIPLTSNQIQYSLLYRYPEENGLLQCCRDLGVQVLSYSPKRNECVIGGRKKVAVFGRGLFHCTITVSVVPNQAFRGRFCCGIQQAHALQKARSWARI